MRFEFYSYDLTADFYIDVFEDPTVSNQKNY